MQWCAELTSGLSKGRSLSILSLTVLAGFVISGQEWFSVSMSPNDESVTLQNFDGYTSYAWLSPLLLVCLAATSTAAISASKTRLISLVVGAVSSALLLLLVFRAVLFQDLSGLAKEIEAATGIAATHGVSDLAVTTQLPAWLAIGVFALICLTFAGMIFWQRGWVAKKPNTGARKIKAEPDSIALWDEQR